MSHSESATKLWQADESTRGRRRQKLGSVHEPVPLIFPSSFDHHRKSDHILTKKPMPESCCVGPINLQSFNAWGRMATHGGAFPSDVTNVANRAPRSDQTRLVWPAANQKLRRCYLSHASQDLGTPSFRSKFTWSSQQASQTVHGFIALVILGVCSGIKCDTCQASILPSCKTLRPKIAT